MTRLCVAGCWFLTVHYNGRVVESGKSPKTGIHAKVDALLDKLEVDPAVTARGIRPTAVKDVLPFIVTQIKRNREQIDRVYELESGLPAVGQSLAQDSQVATFAQERLCVAGTFFASLVLTAWEKSAQVQLPRWHERPESK